MQRTFIVRDAGVNMNILKEFSNELGYINIGNQYIELSVRYYKREHGTESLEPMARAIGLSISTLPEDYYARVAKGYIVGIQSCFEKYLSAFKELCGNPTENIEPYNPKTQKTNRLEWTLKACYGNHLPDDVREYYYICNYYRLARNHSVHRGEQSAEYKSAWDLVEKIDKSLLKSGMCDRLEAPNPIEKLTFDDQVLFSRVARLLAERIYKDSRYNWNKILTVNHEMLVGVAGTVRDDTRKRDIKIINFLAQTYPAKGQHELVDCLQSFVL